MKLLDLFCGAGGAAMGYSRAGFDEIVGVDIAKQPRYPFTFVQGDALEYLAGHGSEFDAIHASPPCQAYCGSTAWRGDRTKHPDLIDVTREALISTGKPYVIENVPDARNRLRAAIFVCGSHVGVPVRRHRYFECSHGFALSPVCTHRPEDAAFDHGDTTTESAYRDAMGCKWMTAHEARQAIPPAFTEFIGRQLMDALLLSRLKTG